MNPLAEQFESLYVDLDDEIIEPDSRSTAPIVEPSSRPIDMKPLHGYEAIMRKHAAACEAGR
jgi:hypothetical protein